MAFKQSTLCCGEPQAAVASHEAAEAAAAERVIQAFCKGNPDGQSSLAATLQAAGDLGEPNSW